MTYHRTPLHLCVQTRQDEDCTRLLLSKGADPYCQDFEGRTALHTFYNQTSERIIQMNYDDLDPWTQDQEGMTLLHYLCRSNKSTVALLQRVVHNSVQTTKTQHSCLDLRDFIGRSMLHFAVQRGNIEIIKFFLAHPSFDTLAKPDWKGKTLLHYATESSRTHAIDIVHQEGFDLQETDASGCTALHHAAMRDNLAAFIRLLDLGAWNQLSSTNRNNQTPYETAVSYRAKDVAAYLEKLGLPEISSLPLISNGSLSAVPKTTRVYTPWYNFTKRLASKISVYRPRLYAACFLFLCYLLNYILLIPELSFGVRRLIYIREK